MGRSFSLLIVTGALMLAGFRTFVPSLPPSSTVVANEIPVPVVATRHAPDARLRRAAMPGPLPAQLTRVIDGDTFEAQIRIWFGLQITTLVRVQGIDAPEIRSHCAQEAEGARAATLALSRFLATGLIQLRDIKLDKYGGRVVARVWVGKLAGIDDRFEDIASLMLATGIVRQYTGGRRMSWCDQKAMAN